MRVTVAPVITPGPRAGETTVAVAAAGRVVEGRVRSQGLLTAVLASASVFLPDFGEPEVVETQPPRQRRGRGPRAFTDTCAPQSSHVISVGLVFACRFEVLRQSAQKDGTGPRAFTATTALHRLHEIVSGRPTCLF